MRHFSYVNFIKLLASLVLLQIPWLVGLLPFYTLFEADKPVGWLIWVYGFLYILIFSMTIVGFGVVLILFYELYRFLWPKDDGG